MLIAKQNRAALFAKLQPNSIVIMLGNKIQYRSLDVEYAFRQNSNFYYLTNLNEPNAIAVFIKSNDQQNQFILFSQELNLERATWTGPIVGQQDAIEIYGADAAYSIEQIDQILPELLINKDILYYPIFQEPMAQITELEANLHKWRALAQKLAKIKSNKYFPRIVHDLNFILHEMRVIKSPLELEKIRYATKISALAHEHLMRYVAKNIKLNKQQLTERSLQAEFYSYCLQHGCQEMAYPPIVASGKNACILHYTKNSESLKFNDLVLIDAGAEYDYYAADITRVFPVNGKFSTQQKEIYNLVLHAQQQAINKIKPGLLWSELQQTILYIIVQGLIDLKLLIGSVDELISTNAYKQFYMHGSGHFLGMDVHDPSSYKLDDNSYRALLPGMVLTVEPGIYWQEIGVRIEDDILVTPTGHEILTKYAIKDIEDIEYLMKQEK